MIRTNFIQFIDQPLPPHTWQDQNSIHMISVAGQEESSHSARETGACFIDERTDVCLWADLGTAGSGSGLLSECGWCADRIPGLKGHQDLRFRLNWGDCRGPQHTDCYSSRPHAPDCWYCCWSHCWMTEKHQHISPLGVGSIMLPTKLLFPFCLMNKTLSLTTIFVQIKFMTVKTKL